MSALDSAFTTTDLLPAVTSLAVRVFRKRADPAYRNPADEIIGLMGMDDPVLQEAQARSFVLSASDGQLANITKQLLDQEDFSLLAPREGELDPMLLHAGGGTRISPDGLLSSILASAFLQIYFLRLPQTENTFVRTALQGLDELRRAIRGEQIRAYIIHGVGGLTIPESGQVSTPWGTLRPAPAVPEKRRQFLPFRYETSCILAEPKLVSVRFDRAPSPEHRFDSAEVSSDRARVLLPLSCALASSDPSKAVAPLMSWSTLLIPFASSFGYSMSVLPPRMKQPIDIGGLTASIEEWARRVEACHLVSIDIAARRLVSALAHRSDRTDALIDAVMVWENLVGTSAETTFRVTGALSKAIESDRHKRRERRKLLARVYDVRSRVVHGTPVELSVIDEAATQAVEIAILSLRDAYHRGREWLSLSSTERADALLLEEP